MTDPAFYDKLSIVRKQVGDTIPTNILEYFLKESGGDINHCISLIKDNYIKPWDTPTRTTPPEHSVHLLHETSSRPTHTPPTQPIGMTRHSDNSRPLYYDMPRGEHTHSLHPGSSPQYKISPPPYTRGTPRGFEPISPYSYHSHQNEVDYPSQSFQSSYRGSGNDRGLNLSRYNSTHKEGPRRPPESMPVRVPYEAPSGGGVNYYDPSSPPVASSNQRSPFTNTLSFIEITLQLQREQLQKAKNEHDSLHKVYIAAQNEVKEREQKLRDVRRQISVAQSDFNEDELYMAECINNSLRYDISKERERKRLHYTASVSFTGSSSSLSWQCPHCAWSNNGLVPSCEKCPYTKP